MRKQYVIQNMSDNIFADFQPWISDQGRGEYNNLNLTWELRNAKKFDTLESAESEIVRLGPGEYMIEAIYTVEESRPTQLQPKLEEL